MNKKYFIRNGPKEPRRQWLTVNFSETNNDPAQIHIDGQIGPSHWDDSGNTSDKFKEAFNAIPAGRKIHVHVNSEGGSVQDGLGIYNCIATRAGDTTCIIDGYALSIASIFPLAADKVVSPKSSIWMMHNASSLTQGNAADHLKSAEMLKKHDETLVNIYHDRTGKSKKEIRDCMDAETWMTGDEAVEFGLADEMGTEDVSLRPIQASGYRNIPETLKSQNLVLNQAISPPVNGNGGKPKTGDEPGNTEQNMNKKEILALLKTHGKELPEDSTEAVIMAALAEITKPKAAAEPNAAILAQMATITAQLETERRNRITARVNKCVDECRITKTDTAAWIEDALKNESILARLESMPVNDPGGRPLATIEASEGFASPLDELKSKIPLSPARYDKLKAQWTPLMHDARARDGRRGMQVFNVNTYSASLVTQFLLDGAVTKLQNRWAALKTFLRDYSTDRYKPLATGQLKFVTAGSAGLTNPTNFEQGNSTVTNVAITVAHLSQPFQVSDSDLNSGLRMENLMEVNTAALADSVISLAVAPITAANFNSFPSVVSAPDAFSWSDMQKCWGNLKKSPIHNALLDGEYLARIINVPTQFQKSGVEPGTAWSEFGWDNIALNTNWTGAGANVRGFYCNPQAIGAIAGLPLTPPTIPGATLQENSITIPGPDITIADYMWFSLASRTLWCSFDLMFGAALLDETAGGLITSA